MSNLVEESVKGFNTHTGRVAILPQDNVDTDRIIPARYLTRVTKSGYGELLFHDVRDENFPLDQPQAEGASVLIVGTNFGCGSSREHAVWAIQQAGFVAVFARRDEDSAAYSDIFRQNGANCGLLLGELDTESHEMLTSIGSGALITVDLPNQKIEVGCNALDFDINPVTKRALEEGLDLIGTTMIFTDKIGEYEQKSEIYVPDRSEI